MNGLSASAGDNPIYQVLDEPNNKTQSTGPEYERHQDRGFNLGLIHEDDGRQSPQFTNMFSEPWEESPTSKGLLQQRNDAVLLDRVAIAPSNLFHRPSGAESIDQPITFCFKPAHNPMQLQLGLQNTKSVHTLEQGEKLVDHQRAAFPASEEKPAETEEKASCLRDIGSAESPSNSHERVPSPKQNSLPVDSAPESPEQEDSHDAHSITTPFRHPSCRTVEHLEDAVDCTVVVERHSSSSSSSPSVSPSPSRETVDTLKDLNLTPSVNAPTRHAREVTPSNDELSIVDNHEMTLKTDSTPVGTGTIERQRPKFPGRGPVRPSGVVKTPNTPRLHRSAIRRLSGPPTAAFPSEQGPSEEDLLYFLMYRTRETAKSMQKLESLKHQNLRLQEERVVSEARLEEAENAQRQLLGKQAIVDQCLESFKDKYYKLKNWALEANKDCEVLQNKSVDLQQALAELMKERDHLRTRLEDLTNVHDNSLGQMDRMRGLIRDVRQIATDSSAASSRKDGLLEAKCEHLRREQARCEKLEAHIAQVERHKHRQDQRLQDERDRQNKSLQEIFGELTRLAIGGAESKSESRKIVDCVRTCQLLLQKQPASILDLSQIKDNIESMTELIDSRTTSTVETLREEINSLGQAIKSRTSIECEQSLQAAQESNRKLAKAQEKVAQLEQTNEQSKVIMDLLRNGMEVAENREAYLKNNTEKLIEALTDGRGNAQKQLDHLKNANEALLTKWQAANTQAVECKGQNDEKSRQIKLLGIQMHDLQKEKDSIVGQIQTLTQELVLSKEESKKQMDEKISRSESRIRKVQADLTDQTQLRQQSERDLMRLNDHLSKIQEELKRSQSTSTLAVHEKDDMAKRLALLQEELSKAREDVNLFAQMQLDLAAKSAEVDDLKESHSKYEQAKQELISQQERVSRKTQEAESLASQVETLQRQSSSLEQKAQDRDILAEGNANLKKEANGLRQKLEGLQHLRDQLDKQNAQLEQLQSALNQAKTDLSRMRKLEENNKSLKEAFDSMSAELAIANEKTRKLDALQEIIAQKEERLGRVEGELESHVAMSEELVKTKADLTLKQNELSQLRDRLSTLETGQAARLPARPMRRAADRSAQSAIPAPDDYRHDLQFDEDDMDPIQATGLTDANPGTPQQAFLNLTTSTQSVIADTQPEIEETLREIPDSFQSQRHTLENLGLLETGDTSSLSDIADPFNGDEFLGDEDMAYLEEPGASLQSSHNENAGDGSAGCSESAPDRPPSSSYGSLNEQMLLDINPLAESQLERNKSLRRGEPTRHPRTPRNDRTSVELDQVEDLIQDEASERIRPSPRRLRSVFHSKRKRATASPERRAETPRNRESTPLVAREKYQPNSAAKRKIEQSEDQQPSKQLKRTPANLEVSISRASQGNSQKNDQTPSKTIITFRRSSVVGTNAPAPGKGQKASKPARRGSRQEKYSSRFGVQR